MKGITNKLTLTIALVALFGLASCTQVDTGTGGYGSGSGGSSGGGSGSSGGGTGGSSGDGSGGSGGGSGGASGGGSGGYSGGGSGGGSGSSSGGGSGGVTQSYVVQLLATKSASKAASVKNTFVREGYRNTTVNTINRGGQVLHRVQIGPFGTQADGQRVLNQMKRRYHKNPYVNSAVVKTIYGR